MIPNVKNIVIVGNCKFTIYAYKKLNKAEIKLALRQWLRQTNRKTIPKSGNYKIITIFGFDSE